MLPAATNFSVQVIVEAPREVIKEVEVEVIKEIIKEVADAARVVACAATVH